MTRLSPWHWAKRIGFGLFLFSWAWYGMLNRTGSLTAFCFLMSTVAIIGAWEIVKLSNEISLFQRASALGIWCLLVASTVGLRLENPLLLLLAIYAGAGYDTCALAIGQLFDPRHLHPLFPTLSQRKTLAATVGGIHGGWLCAWSFQLAWLPEWSFGWSMLAIMPCPFLAFLGDLAPSVAKKRLGLRHSGETLPRWAQVFGSHGGALDRCLSILLPVIWIALVTSLRKISLP